MKADKKELAGKILDYRIEHNMSQVMLAQKCDVTNQTINNIENGRQTPSKLTLGKILKVIDGD